MRDFISTSDVIANINKFVAGAHVDLKLASSEEETIICKNRIDRLSAMKEQILEEDHKRAVKYQTNLNFVLLETESSSNNDLPRSFPEESSPTENHKDTVVFMALPFGLRDSIFEKFDYPTLTLFDECCQFSHELCENTKKKFVSDKIASGGFKNNHWNLGPRPFVPCDVLKIEDLKNVYFKFKTIMVIMDTLTDDLCFLLMSQVKTDIMQCDGDFTCSPQMFSQLIQTVGVKTLHIRKRLRGFQYDTSKLNKVYFCLARYFSTENILRLKAKSEIVFENLEIESIKFKIESMINDGSYQANFWCFNMNPQVFENILKSFGDRAQLTAGTTNCWSITDGRSEKPRLVVVLKGYIQILPPDVFRNAFGRYAEFQV